jgi:GT2 family glycosyltransferase
VTGSLPGTTGEPAVGGGFRPFLLTQVEISTPLPDLSAISPRTGCRYSQALCLVRLLDHPIGIAQLELPTDGLTAEAYAEQIWAKCDREINERLVAQGFRSVNRLNGGGLPKEYLEGAPKRMQQPGANTILVSIVISTRDRPDYLDACLTSLRSLKYPRYEVIVVDNAPTSDETRRLVSGKYSAMPNIRYVKETRTGLSWARNAGIAYARGEIVAFTDDDVVVDALWLTRIVEALRSDNRVACVTGLALPLELETPSQLWFEAYGGFGRGFTRRVFDLEANCPADPLYPYRPSVLGSGCNMAFWTWALHKIGGFDPGFGVGSATKAGEESVAFYGILDRGYRIVYEPGALVWHLHRREYAALKKQIWSYGVGLTACLAKITLNNPKHAWELMLRIPDALSFVLKVNGMRASDPEPRCPAQLRRLELKGLLYGPFAFLYSRWQMWRTVARVGISG